MKANELRIGNYVLKSLKSGNGRKIEVKIDINDFIRICDGSEIYNFEPIPLTEECLLKFGFKETSDKDFIGGLYTRGKDGFYINKETMSYCGIDYEGTIDDIVEINYVHELQNLYFALTKEELTMK